MNPCTNIAKNLSWPDPKLDDPEVAARAIAHAIQRGGTVHGDVIKLPLPTHQLLGLLRHKKVGVQVWVSGEVSYDLEHTDIVEPDFASVPLLGESMEFYFEDPAIPSFLLAKPKFSDLFRPYEKRVNELMGWGTPELGPTEVDLKLSLTAGSASDTRIISTTSLTPENMNTFARTGEVPDRTGVSEYYDAGDRIDLNEGRTHELARYKGIDFDDRDTEAFRWMAGMAFKVLFFASIDRFKPRRTREKPTRAQGGKPGFLGRPATERFQVVYLPRQRDDARRENHGEGGKSHAFLGRRGHMRTYRSERYKEMRGKRVFVAPVPGPDGTIPSRKTFRIVAPRPATPLEPEAQPSPDLLEGLL